MVLAAGAVAQTNGTGGTRQPTETVVVSGNRNIDSILSGFVDRQAATNRKTGQYIRDDLGPVCPVAMGMPDAFNKFVTDRVVAVVKSNQFLRCHRPLYAGDPIFLLEENGLPGRSRQ